MPISSNLIPLAGSERAALPGARTTGAADPKQVIQVTVLIRQRRPVPADTVSAASGDNMPHQHPALSLEEFEATHGADPADVAQVVEFAREHDLRVVEANGLQRKVVLSGTVARFSAAFGVVLDRYEHPRGAYRGRSGPVFIPKHLDGIVQGVFGLDDRPQAEPRVGVLDRQRSIGPHVGGSFTPPQLAQLYGFPTGVTGTGQTIALIELGGGFSVADLQAYFQQLLLPLPLVDAISVDGAINNPADTTPNAVLEVMLDIEVAGAIAPGAHIVAYFAPNTSQSFLNAILAAVHDAVNRPSIISISWGGSESNFTAQSMRAFDQAFQAAAALGITVCVASGDNGSGDGVSDGRAHVDFPASSPLALGCGGTSLSGLGSVIGSEVVWNNAANQVTGGGVSDQFPLPIYQGSANVPPSANGNGRVGRGVPDVSGHAASFVVRVNGAQISAFGTSGVAPMWAGLIALTNQILGRRIGFASGFLYQNRAACRDINSGNNGAYQSGAGWDACTGLGSPNGASLLRLLTPPFLPASERRNFIQGTFGQRGNFELLVPQSSVIHHYFRDNDAAGFPWHLLTDRALNYPQPPGQLGPTPRSVTLIQSNFRDDGVRGNLEAIVRVAPALATQPDHLDFWLLPSNATRWIGPIPVMADGLPITNVTGDPVFLQSTFGRRGNFEMLVPQGSVVHHYFRDNDAPGFPWHLLTDRALNYPHRPTQLGPTPRSVTFIQSNFRSDGVHGNLEAIVRVAPPIATQPDHLDFWFLPSNATRWIGPIPVVADDQPITNVTGDPVLLQGTFGRRGNFEMLVPQGSVVHHYFRDNDAPGFPWHLLTDRALNYPQRPGQLGPMPRSATFIQSNFRSDGVHGNLEAIVRVAPPIATQPDHLDFWFLESGINKWNGPFPIVADGQPISAVTGS